MLSENSPKTSQLLEPLVANEPAQCQDKGSPRNDHKNNLTVFEAGLALLSTIIGGGIVGMPFALFHTGIPIGVVSLILVCLLNLYSGHLLLLTRKISPMPVNSFYELGFVTMGSKSVYLISILMLSLGIGSLILYFVLFGEISASIVRTASGRTDPKD